MNKQQALEELAKYLPPDRLYQIVQALAPEMLKVHDVDIVSLAPARADKDGEPFFDTDCPHCAARGIKAAHMLGTTDMCPHNPARFGWMQKRKAR